MRIFRTILLPFLALLLSGTAWARVHISVLPLEGKGVPTGLLPALAEEFRKSLSGTGAFTVMERDKMEALLKEQAFQMTGIVEESQMVQVGRMIGVKQVVSASITKVEGRIFAVTAKLIDVESGQILITASEKREGDSFDINRRMLHNVATVLAGKPSEDHLEYVRRQQTVLAEDRQVERIGSRRFRAALTGYGFYPLYIAAKKNEIPRRKYYEATPEITEWGLPEDQMEFGTGGTFAYRIKPQLWVVGRMGYTSTGVRESHAKGNYYNDSTIITDTVTGDWIRMEGPSVHLSRGQRHYNMFDIGLGARYDFLRTPKMTLGATMIPAVGFVKYYEDSRDSSFTNNNFYTNGIYWGKGQIYSETKYLTELTGSAFGTDLSVDLDFFLTEQICVSSQVGFNFMIARSVEGESDVEKFEIVQNMSGTSVLDTSYTESAALMTGNYLGTGEYTKVKNPDVKDYNPSGQVVSEEKAKFEMANFRLTLGLVYYF